MYLGLEHGLDIHQHAPGDQNPRARLILLPTPRWRRRSVALARAPAPAPAPAPPPPVVLLGPSLLLGGAFVVYAPDVLLAPRRRPPAAGGAADCGPGDGRAVGAGDLGGEAAPARAQARRLHALARSVARLLSARVCRAAGAEANGVDFGDSTRRRSSR